MQAREIRRVGKITPELSTFLVITICLGLGVAMAETVTFHGNQFSKTVDGVDDDGDGATDCADSECSGKKFCR